MATNKTKIENKTTQWRSNGRYRVNDSVLHNGKSWINVNGRNVEPGTNANVWIESALNYFPDGGNKADNAQTLRDDVNVKPTIVSTVAALKTYSGNIKQGQLFQTIGFLDTIDIGGANYIYDENISDFDEITSFKSSTHDGGFTLKINEKFLNVAQLGATGENDADIIERAIAVSGGNLYVPIDIHIERQINVTDSFRMLCYGDIKGAGLNSRIFNFEPKDENDNKNIDIKIEGFSNFLESSSAIYVSRNVNQASFSNLNFTQCLNGITFVNQTGESYFGRMLKMTNCDFSNSENGLYSFMYDWETVEVLGGGAKNMATNETISLANRSHPMSKGDINGIYIRNTTKDHMTVSVIAFHTNGITNTTPAVTYTETHGVAVALADDTQTDVMISNCNAKNITGTRLDGVEGIMGRGRRVVINSSTAYDAGGTEGSIYTKGSRFHKVSGCTVEVSPGNPRRDIIRGIISTGSNCDITNNKFIGMRFAVYSRSPKTTISVNDFIDVDTCVQLQIEEGVQHEFTKIQGNTCDGHATTDFVYQGAVANGASYGDLIMDNNEFKGNRLAVLRQFKKVSIGSKHTIDRHENAASRDLIEFGGGLIGELEFSYNSVKNFQRLGGDGRILTGNNNTPRIKFIGNPEIKNGHSAVRLRDRSLPYEQVIIKDNDFDESVDYPIFGDYNVNYTVSGDYIVKDNVGLENSESFIPFGFNSGQALEGSEYGEIEIIDIPDGATHSLNRNTKLPALHISEGSTTKDIGINHLSLENYDVKKFELFRGDTNGEINLVENSRCLLRFPEGKSNQIKKNGKVEIMYFSTVNNDPDPNEYIWLVSGDLKDKSLELTPESQTLNSGGGSFNLDITTDRSWNITDDAGGWLSYSATSGTGNTTITVTYTANPAPEIGRYATISVNDGNETKTCGVSQNPV